MSKPISTFSDFQDQVIDALLRAFSPARRTCARAERLISINADGEATEAERLELNAHLERCPTCRALENATLLVRADLRERPRAALPDALAARLATALENEQRRERLEVYEREAKRRVLAPRLRLAGGFGAAAAFAGLIAFNTLHTTQPSGNEIRPVVHTAKSNPANRPALPFESMPPHSVALGTGKHSPPNIPHAPVLDTGVSKPTQIASSDIPQAHRRVEKPIISIARRAQLISQSRREQEVATNSDNSESFFPERGKLVSRLNAVHPSSSLIAHSHASGLEIASQPAHSNKPGDLNVIAPAAQQPSEAQVASSITPPEPSQQQILQNSLSARFRNLAIKSQRDQIQQTRATITETAYSGSPDNSSNGASLVYANIKS